MQLGHGLGVILRARHALADGDHVEGVDHAGELLHVLFGGVADFSGFGIDEVDRLPEVGEHDARAVKDHVAVRSAPGEHDGLGRAGHGVRHHPLRKADDVLIDHGRARLREQRTGLGRTDEHARVFEHLKGSPMDGVHLVLREDVETEAAPGEAAGLFPTLCHSMISLWTVVSGQGCRGGAARRGPIRGETGKCPEKEPEPGNAARRRAEDASCRKLFQGLTRYM